MITPRFIIINVIKIIKTSLIKDIGKQIAKDWAIIKEDTFRVTETLFEEQQSFTLITGTASVKSDALIQGTLLFQ